VLLSTDAVGGPLRAPATPGPRPTQTRGLFAARRVCSRKPEKLSNPATAGSAGFRFSSYGKEDDDDTALASVRTAITSVWDLTQAQMPPD
jgi:hypothetical protein